MLTTTVSAGYYLSLVMATFALTILGTFLTRSGVVQSVHAFAQSNVGPYLITGIVLTGFGVKAFVSPNFGFRFEGKVVVDRNVAHHCGRLDASFPLLDHVGKLMAGLPTTNDGL